MTVAVARVAAMAVPVVVRAAVSVWAVSVSRAPRV